MLVRPVILMFACMDVSSGWSFVLFMIALSLFFER